MPWPARPSRQRGSCARPASRPDRAAPDPLRSPFRRSRRRCHDRWRSCGRSSRPDECRSRCGNGRFPRWCGLPAARRDHKGDARAGDGWSPASRGSRSAPRPRCARQDRQGTPLPHRYRAVRAGPAGSGQSCRWSGRRRCRSRPRDCHASRRATQGGSDRKGG